MQGLDFFAIDFETANRHRHSICAVGIAKFENGVLINKKSILINPLQEFDDENIFIHGIEPEDVEGEATFTHFYKNFVEIITNDNIPLVSHSSFDKSAFYQAVDYYNLPAPPEITWINSLSVARRAWDEYSQRGAGLANLCDAFNIPLDHHEPSSDAAACGYIFVKACKDNNKNISDWNTALCKKIPSYFERLSKGELTGDVNGKLKGNIIVFTGNLTLSRVDAAVLAAKVGCDVGKGVTKKTTMLVVGDQDLSVLAGHEKSSKHRRAEELINKGQEIKILKESDFMRLVSS